MATSIASMPLTIISQRVLEAPAPFDLHAPDGFFSVPVALAMWVVAIVVIAVSVRRVGDTFDERAVPLMGVTAAFIFAAQMINFPVVGGTSGHLLGAVLAAILLGPWAGTLVITSVIAVQSLLFQDGGLPLVRSVGGITVLKTYPTQVHTLFSRYFLSDRHGFRIANTNCRNGPAGLHGRFQFRLQRCGQFFNSGLCCRDLRIRVGMLIAIAIHAQ